MHMHEHVKLPVIILFILKDYIKKLQRFEAQPALLQVGFTIHCEATKVPEEDAVSFTGEEVVYICTDACSNLTKHFHVILLS